MSQNVPVKEKAPETPAVKRDKKENVVAKEQVTLRLTPRTDVLETKDGFLIVLDMPGAGKDDVTVNFEEGIVSVGGKALCPECGDRKPLHRTFDIREYYRSFQLPEGIDISKIEAKMQDGVLTITLPKSEEIRPRQIPISSQ